jgi:hypothetical protein
LYLSIRDLFLFAINKREDGRKIAKKPFILAHTFPVLSSQELFKRMKQNASVQTQHRNEIRMGHDELACKEKEHIIHPNLPPRQSVLIRIQIRNLKETRVFNL